MVLGGFRWLWVVLGRSFFQYLPEKNTLLKIWRETFYFTLFGGTFQFSNTE